MFSDNVRQPDSQIADTRLPPVTALRCFEAAARLESFSRAADALHLTHGAISRAVRLIEDDLGTALFERRSRRVFLTDSGRRLAQAVREAFGLIGEAARDIRNANVSGPITLSCEPTLLMRWLIPRLPAFYAAHPGIEMHLVAAGGQVRLGNGIDLAIRRSDFPLLDTMHADVLFDERTGPVCRTDMVDRFFATTDDAPVLRGDTPLLHTRTRPDAWATWSAASGAAPSPGPSHILEHFYLTLQAASAGIGVAIGSWEMVRDEIASGMLAAPLGFVGDGSRYLLLSSLNQSPQVAAACKALLAWSQDMSVSDGNEVATHPSRQSASSRQGTSIGENHDAIIARGHLRLPLSQNRSLATEKRE